MLRELLRYAVLSVVSMTAVSAAALEDVDYGLKFEVDGIAYAVYDYANPGRVATVVARDGGYTGDVVIPETVTYGGDTYTVARIEKQAFYNAYGTSLTSINIPPSITYIGANAFLQCTSLEAVYITDLDAWCRIEFYNNPLRYAHNLYLDGSLVTELRIPASLTSVADMAFYGASCITSVVFPASLTAIGGSAFAMCTGIEQLVVPEPVASIGNSAFYHCTSLTTVWLPATLSNLGGLAFAECTSLSTMYSAVQYGTTVTRGEQVFTYSPTASGTLYVPDDAKYYYENREAWQEWGTIVELHKCATPEISLSGNDLTFTCATEGATINASITSEDFGEVSQTAPVARKLTGVYTVTAQATAPDYLTSDAATAYVAWSLAEDPFSGAEQPSVPLLFKVDGGGLMVVGTEAGDTLSVFDFGGTLLLRQPTQPDRPRSALHVVADR